MKTIEVDEEKLRRFINASLFTCMDLNYYLFHKKSCHNECCDCPLTTVESTIEWLRKECSSNCEACKQNCVEELIKCIKDQK